MRVILLMILLSYFCLNQGTNALMYKKEGESMWKEIDTFPFVGNRLESENFTAIMLPNSINYNYEDDSLFSCKYINQSFDVLFLYFIYLFIFLFIFYFLFVFKNFFFF